MSFGRDIDYIIVIPQMYFLNITIPIKLTIFMPVKAEPVVAGMVAITIIHIQTILPVPIMATILLLNIQQIHKKLKMVQSSPVVEAADLEPHIIPLILVVLVDLVLLSLDMQFLQL